jgi:L-ascorbate metabolism protein UlaG (beta-lactamase superfamily)
LKNTSAAFALCALAAFQSSPGGLEAQAAPKKSVLDLANSIRWLGQSALVIPMGGKTVFVDPLGLGTDEGKKADIILITHSHSDHYSKADMVLAAGPRTVVVAPFAIKDKAFPDTRLIAPGKSLTVGEIRITAVPSYNIVKKDKHPKSSGWVGYLISSGGLTVYAAGDTERIPEMKGIDCDIVFLPLGQTYTMSGPDEAAQAALDVKAEIAVPYHYGMYEGSAEDALEFKRLLDGKIRVIVKDWKKE